MTPTRTLTPGVEIPQVGLGVFRAPPGEAKRAVGEALRLGYRHVDTAQAYGNEADVGAAFAESGLPREDLFVTTKIWNDAQGYDSTLRAFDESRRRLGVDRIDLLLLHWPVEGRRLDSWRALERLFRDGRARAIGVSNFLVHHLDELEQHATILPHVDQIEVHPFHQQSDTRRWCAERGITVEAYSPLAKGRRFTHPVVTAIAARVERTPAQVLLRWGVQHDLVILPKSVRADRIAQNAALFDFALSDDDMAALDRLDEGRATGWDPRTQA